MSILLLFFFFLVFMYFVFLDLQWLKLKIQYCIDVAEVDIIAFSLILVWERVNYLVFPE